jgi:sulfite reductase (NADPH) hemoprotein beta-component
MIVCPGGDYCSLANARSLPIAAAIAQRFEDLDFLSDLGDLSLNISGCINACGHHHMGNIGVLGVDKDGEEWYQVTIGGAQGNQSSIGKVIGRSFEAKEMPDVVERIVETYCQWRVQDEPFSDTFARIGIEPFKANVYRETV